MENQLESKLKNHGKIIQNIAQKRLKTFQINDEFLVSRPSTNEKNAYATNQRMKIFGFGTAAAVLALVSFNIFNFNLNESKSEITPIEISSNSFKQNIKKYSSSAEKLVNQKIKNEQKAIIQDIKSLSMNMFSI